MSDNTTEEEFDFTKVEWQRGKTPHDIKQKCFQLCRDYLGGVWLNLTIDEVEVKRISGGLTNQLYYCAIDQNKRITDISEPQEVSIRCYGDKHFNNYEETTNERLTDTIIALMLSENGLGPKIYGLFEGGQIQPFYKHKQFRRDEQGDPKLVEQVARKLAWVHALDVPIKKTGNWVFDTFDNFYKTADTLFDLNSLYSEANCSTLKEKSLSKELDWLKTTILECDSPIDFTHVDFRGSNIMVTETDGIILCDFEYSCYGFRGADFGTIFSEWGRSLEDLVKPINFVDDSILMPFIETYIEESVKLRGNQFIEDKRNSLQHILREGKVFSLVSVMFFILITLKANESIIEGMPFDKKKAMGFCEIYYNIYHHLKQQFVDQKVF